VTKRLELLRELVPTATTIAVLINPTHPNAEAETADVRTAAQALGRQVHVLTASTDREITAAFTTLRQEHLRALLVGADPFFLSRHDQIVALAARNAVPAIFEWREFAAAGGLISYGTSRAGVYRQVGRYTGRILKGAKPADLPVEQPTEFELVVNLKTAKALGLTVPPSILIRADEVIQ
jgi:ABC-type uncharacterized transport system substrate-binding protein